MKKRKRIEAALDYLKSALDNVKEMEPNDLTSKTTKFIEMARDTLNGE